MFVAWQVKGGRGLHCCCPWFSGASFIAEEYL